MSHLKSFILDHVNSKQNLVWKGVWAAIVWSIWEHRNRIVFKQGKVDVEEIFHLPQLKSWLWLKYRMKSIMYSLPNWIMTKPVHKKLFLKRMGDGSEQ